MTMAKAIQHVFWWSKIFITIYPDADADMIEIHLIVTLHSQCRKKRFSFNI